MLDRAEDAAAAGPTLALLLRLGRALHRYGYPAPHLEAALTRVADRFAIASQFFSTPTSLFCAFGPDDRQHTYMLRVEPGEVNLGKLAALQREIETVQADASQAAAAARRVEAIDAAGSPYPPLLVLLAAGLGSGGAALFLGGGLRELLIATGIGLALGVLGVAFQRQAARLRGLLEPVAAALAAFLAGAGAHWIGPASIYIATLAGLIVLLPGFTLTVALTELATRHLVSGTARLMGALTTFLTLGFGVAVGKGLALALFGASDAAPPWEPLGAVRALALVVAPLSFCVLLRAAPRDAPWILLVSVIAIEGGQLGSDLFGVELGAFVGALAVGIASDLYAHFLRRPALVTLVPGILLLVPGSIGFRSVASLLDKDVVFGVETGFRMAFVAISLVAGLLMANVVAPRRRPAA
ncbi:MAG: threonine/serine ThrE exporter family protein [Acidobacteriota bacterium]